MLKIVLIRPGSTDIDEQKRIKGTLDIPLNASGTQQVARVVQELADQPIRCVYSSPGTSAVQTAEALAKAHRVRLKQVEDLRNVDHGLWHGKLIEELKLKQPKVYRQWLDHPEAMCPPAGEPLCEAQDRACRALDRIMNRHREGVVAVVCSEPLASMVACHLKNGSLGDLLESGIDCGTWELIEVEPHRRLVTSP